MANITLNKSSNSQPCIPPFEIYFLHISRTYYNNNFVIFIIIINALCAVVSSFNNFIVIYTILRTRSLLIPSNILILGLAVSDFGVGFVAQPSYSLLKSFELKRSISNFCSFAVIYNYSIWILAVISLLTLSAITLDRFLAVHLHLRYQELVTTKVYGTTLVSIWIISPVACVCRMFFHTNILVNILAMILFFLVITLNLFFIFKISRVIHRHSIQIQAQQQSTQQSIDMPRYKKSVNTMYYVIGAFLLCYSPFTGTLIIHSNDSLRRTQSMLFVATISETFIMFNGVFNPIIYFWRIEEIRNSASQLLRKSFRNIAGTL